MIDALIGGKIYGQPTPHTDRNGNTYVTAKVRAPAVNGEGVFVSVIAFEELPVTGLLALSDGDSVAISGELTPKVWTPQNGAPRPALDLVAHAVLTSYHVSRKREAMSEDAA